MSQIKQVIIVRADLQMSPGKTAAQACHASIQAYDKADKADIDQWKRNGVTKIVLRTTSWTNLLMLYEEAIAHELPAAIICDEGRTEVKPGTFTCMAIGPAPSNLINKVTGSLPLL